jgi:hypothetical protein
VTYSKQVVTERLPFYPLLRFEEGSGDSAVKDAMLIYSPWHVYNANLLLEPQWTGKFRTRYLNIFKASDTAKFKVHGMTQKDIQLISNDVSQAQRCNSQKFE